KEGRWVRRRHGSHRLRRKSSEEHVRASHLRAGDPQATSAAAVLAAGDGIIVPPIPAAESLVPFESAAPAHSGPEPVQVDIIFPVLHGTFGEDGTIQGLLELADIAYVGAGVLGSAAGMDKDVMKRLFAEGGLPLVRHVTVLRRDWQDDAKKICKLIESKLKYPVFVKPANLGSSVGISKVHGRGELPAAMDQDGGYDRKIIVEQGVGGKRGNARAT